MNRLEQMIKELCPNGVEILEIGEFAKVEKGKNKDKKCNLGELFEVRNGYTPSKSNAEYWENGTVPWFRMDDIRENGRILSSAMQKVTMQAVKNKPFPANSIIMAQS